MKKFFEYIQLPNFDIAADAAATFKVGLIWKNLGRSMFPLFSTFCLQQN